MLEGIFRPHVIPVAAIQIRHQRAGIDEDFVHDPNPSRCLELEARSPSPLHPFPHRSALRSNRLGRALRATALSFSSKASRSKAERLVRLVRATASIRAISSFGTLREIVVTLKKVLPNLQIGNTQGSACPTDHSSPSTHDEI